ncbi:response regulator transcription factor [Polaromonas eurypsychrophila]|uniref:DNA-binding response regulator n=1 Tax=Polaromonas eurypsychrophila TaxID=1614635 RepID=A0A916S847_9BURK|nr:response regulator transcription factor [Polaromonas eurypsychrophila]GGA85473.1 DNA-binding response regulator [Polaromonas eurypsychrophila]
MRVLVIEDDEGIATGLQAHLRQLGWAVDMTNGVETAWTALRVEPFDLVLLDLGLGDGDGAEVLRRLRQAPVGRLPDAATPVLVMTARDQVAARIECLDMGADDYVTKPFDPDELAARMRALRRRSVGRAQALLKVGALEIDPANRSVRQHGQPVELSAREFGVLLALVEVRPRVLSRPQIEARLYSWDNALDSNAVEVHVHHLRRKLGEGVIRTLRGVGYFVSEDKA